MYRFYKEQRIFDKNANNNYLHQIVGDKNINKNKSLQNEFQFTTLDDSHKC
jgi:hypothetical protein